MTEKVKATDNNAENGNEEQDISDSLKKLPFMIFLLVAAADGKVDQDEFNSFIYQIESKQVCHSPYSRWLLTQTSDAYPELKELYSKKELTGDIEQIRTLIAYINNKLPGKKALELNQDLERLAVGIAESSGGFLWKPAISKEEKEVLHELHGIFSAELRKMQTSRAKE